MSARRMQRRANDPNIPTTFEAPLDKPQVAAILGLSVSGLDKLTAIGRAPPHFRAGRLLRWRPSVVRQWLLDQEQMQLAGTGAAAE